MVIIQKKKKKKKKVEGVEKYIPVNINWQQYIAATASNRIRCNFGQSTCNHNTKKE